MFFFQFRQICCFSQINVQIVTQDDEDEIIVTLKDVPGDFVVKRFDVGLHGQSLHEFQICRSRFCNQNPFRERQQPLVESAMSSQSQAKLPASRFVLGMGEEFGIFRLASPAEDKSMGSLASQPLPQVGGIDLYVLLYVYTYTNILFLCDLVC